MSNKLNVKSAKIRGNKTLTAIALILMLTMTLPFAAIESANAQTTTRKTTYAFIGATPNPIGVNQETLLFIGTPDA